MRISERKLGPLPSPGPLSLAETSATWWHWNISTDQFCFIPHIHSWGKQAPTRSLPEPHIFLLPGSCPTPPCHTSWTYKTIDIGMELVSLQRLGSQPEGYWLGCSTTTQNWNMWASDRVGPSCPQMQNKTRTKQSCDCHLIVSVHSGKRKTHFKKVGGQADFLRLPGF